MGLHHMGQPGLTSDLWPVNLTNKVLRYLNLIVSGTL